MLREPKCVFPFSLWLCRPLPTLWHLFSARVWKPRAWNLEFGSPPSTLSRHLRLKRESEDQYIPNHAHAASPPPSRRVRRPARRRKLSTGKGASSFLLVPKPPGPPWRVLVGVRAQERDPGSRFAGEKGPASRGGDHLRSPVLHGLLRILHAKAKLLLARLTDFTGSEIAQKNHVFSTPSAILPGFVRPCWECGKVCSATCGIQRAAATHSPVK